MARFSAVIPTYNRAHLVRRAIDSALRQTLPPEEVIVVDDRSSDDTANLLRSWQATDARIRPIIHVVNQGPAGARNTGVGAACGDFVAFLDSDDLWEPGHLEACARLLEARPHLDLAFADVRRVHTDGTILHSRFLTDHKQVLRYLAADAGSPDWFTFRVPEPEALLEQFVVPVQTTVVRREMAVAIPFDTNILGPEDYDFALRAARAGKRFGYVNRVGCQCFIHDTNLLSNGRSAVRESTEERKVWAKLLDDPALLPSERRVVRDRLARLYFDEGCAHRQTGDYRSSLRAHYSALRTRFTWRGLKGLVAAAVLPARASQGN